MVKKIVVVWKNKKQIFEGIFYSIFKRKYIEKVAKERASICATCNDIDKEGISCLVPGTAPCCALCGCNLHLKHRSLSAGCDIKKWGPVLSQEEEDKLYAKLNYDPEHF